MTTPIILAFCAPGARERDEIVIPLCCAFADFIFSDELPARADELPGRALVPLGVGHVGCAGLAAYVQEHGLDGVRAVVLVEPSAPWAERVNEPIGHCEECDEPGHEYREVVPLSALEPLRAVAEMARAGVCAGCEWVYGRGHLENPCKHAAKVVRLILAVCPEAPPCEACGGIGTWAVSDVCGVHSMGQCLACSGTGRALSSAEVARELTGWSTDPANRGPVIAPQIQAEQREGGLIVIQRPTRAALLAHGIEAALRAAMEGAP